MLCTKVLYTELEGRLVKRTFIDKDEQNEKNTLPRIIDGDNIIRRDDSDHCKLLGKW